VHVQTLQQLVKNVGSAHKTSIITVHQTGEGPKYTTHPVDGYADALQTVNRIQTNTPPTQPFLISVDQPTKLLTTQDPSNSKQWGFKPLNPTAAWQHSTGKGIIVAVVDTGVDVTHPDLIGQLVDGINTRDDHGDTTLPTQDDNGHGTHVAGIIAAKANNNVGVAGIAPDAKIMPIKTLGKDGTGWVSDVAEGIVWAVNHDAKIINLSLGSDNAALIAPAIAYAAEQNVTVVAAAGNHGDQTLTYPASIPTVISVAAIAETFTPAKTYTRPNYSNYGPTIDIAAPGDNILSTTPNNSYDYYNGTSMAAPHVAGVAALVRALNPTGDTALTLTTTSQDLGVPGRDDFYGAGIVDAENAVTLACQNVHCPNLQPALNNPTLPNPRPNLNKNVRTVLKNFPKHVKVATTKKLSSKTVSNIRLTTWKSKTLNKCVLLKPLGKKTLVLGVRKGVCRLTYTIVANRNIPNNVHKTVSLQVNPVKR